jgi:hypothetical protein
MAVVPSTEAKNQHQNDDEHQHCRSSFSSANAVPLLLRFASLLLVVALVVFRTALFSFLKPLHPVNFQRAVVFMQSRLDRDVVPLMRSYCFRVLDAVSLLVFVILQHIVVAIFPNPSG